MSRLLYPVIIVAIWAFVLPAFAEEAVTWQSLCDQAAASPLDPKRPPDVPGVEPSKIIPQIAITACEAASTAAPDDPRIAYQLGRAYAAARRYPEAAALYAKADKGGNVLASTNLANFLLTGRGVPKDVPQAVTLWEKAANNGVGAAARNLGEHYTSGKTLPQDYAKARYWLTQASLHDNVAKEKLAYLFSEGLGGSKDLGRSKSLYTEAAKAGRALSQYMLGMLIVTNFPAEEEDLGVYWLQKAASAGSGPATMALGMLNEYGTRKRAKNLGAAHQYYEQASNLDAEGARQALAKLDGRPADNETAAEQGGQAAVRPSVEAPE